MHLVGVRDADDCHDISRRDTKSHDSTIAEVTDDYLDSHDTIQTGTNNCEINYFPTCFCVNFIV